MKKVILLAFILMLFGCNTGNPELERKIAETEAVNEIGMLGHRFFARDFLCGGSIEHEILQLMPKTLALKKNFKARLHTKDAMALTVGVDIEFGVALTVSYSDTFTYNKQGYPIEICGGQQR